MSRQLRRDTAPELALRSALHARGLRFRVEFPVPGLPRRSIDIAFTRVRIAVFVHGCFWHGCGEHGTQPKANAAWWQAKIARNVQRDRETSTHLRSRGWQTLTVWEHEEAEAAVERIIAARSEPSPSLDIDD